MKKNGIIVKFVRAPTGLYSELAAYLRKLGVRKNLNSVTRSIIKEEILLNKKTSKAISKAVVSFSTLRSGLKKQKLHLWGGSSGGGVSAQSWEVESAGEGVKRKDTLNKEFIKKLLGKGKRDRSLVILCHDTTKADLVEVKRDIIMIEDYAGKHNIEIVYHTMSNLYKKVTGNDA